jgi:hypothetical protein
MRKLKSIDFYGDDGFVNIADTAINCQDSAQVSLELSSFLDFSLKEIKKFTDEFIQKIEAQRNYES